MDVPQQPSSDTHSVGSHSADNQSQGGGTIRSSSTHHTRSHTNRTGQQPIPHRDNIDRRPTQQEQELMEQQLQPQPLPPVPPQIRAPSAHSIPVNGDLVGYQPTAADQQLDEVYGDHVHNNPGEHLSGYLTPAVDQQWQDWHTQVAALPQLHYHVPTNKVGRRFIDKLSTLLLGIMKGDHNSEKFLLFPMLMLPRRFNLKGNKNIKKRLDERMDLWDQGKYQWLVEDTIRCLKDRITRFNTQSSQEEQMSQFNRLMLQGEVRRACRFLTDRAIGGVLNPSGLDTDENSVIESLRSKHPQQQQINAADLHHYDKVPELGFVQIAGLEVATVAKKLHGSAGLGGTDAPTLKMWLTKFKTSSTSLQEAVASFVTWMANQIVPHASIRAFLSNRLIALDKNPGVRPIGIGQIWRRLFAKCVLLVTMPAATLAANNDQLCVGLKAGCEGAIHAAHGAWEKHANEPDWGFLAIDAKNAFNMMDRTSMLWTLRHEWPDGCTFAFNCYRHHVLLLVHKSPTGFERLYSKTGVTQGCPIAMPAYGLGLLPLIRLLKAKHPGVLQLWYADDGAIAASFQVIKDLYKLLEHLGPKHGYYPQTKKSVLVVTEANLLAAQNFFKNVFSFEITTGNKYLGAYVGDEPRFQEWLTKKTTDWTTHLESYAGVCVKYPHPAYCGIQKSLQQEWQFVQRTNTCPPSYFETMERSFAETIVPGLFNAPTAPVSRELTKLSAKAAGLGLFDPTDTAITGVNASQQITQHLVNSLLDHDTCFDISLHVDKVTKGREACKQSREDAHAESLATYKSSNFDSTTKAHKHQANILDNACESARVLSIMPSLLHDTWFCDTEFRDRLYIRYGMDPPDLPKRCECGKVTDLNHALNCMHGGLVIQRHDEMEVVLGDACAKALRPSAVREEPFICPRTRSNVQGPAHAPQGPAPQAASVVPPVQVEGDTVADLLEGLTHQLFPQEGGPEAPIDLDNDDTVVDPDLATSALPNLHDATVTDARPVIRLARTNQDADDDAGHKRGDLLVRGFYRRSTDVIVDIHVINLNSDTYAGRTAEAALLSAEKAKIKKYKELCKRQRRMFVPFVVSCCGVLGKEATKFMQRLAQIYSEKYEQPYSTSRNYFNTQLDVTLVRACHNCIRGSRIPRTKMSFCRQKVSYHNPQPPPPDFLLF